MVSDSMSGKKLYTIKDGTDEAAEKVELCSSTCPVAGEILSTSSIGNYRAVAVCSSE